MDADEAFFRSCDLNGGLSPKSRKKRELLALRDGGERCVYCQKEGPLSSFVLEHIVPKSQGGVDALCNRALACPKCDRAKSSRTPQQWRPGVVFGVPAVDNPDPRRRNLKKKQPGETMSQFFQRRRHSPLTFKAAIGIRWCATCSAPVRVHGHPVNHLLLEDPSHEPDV